MQRMFTEQLHRPKWVQQSKEHTSELVRTSDQDIHYSLTLKDIIFTTVLVKAEGDKLMTKIVFDKSSNLSPNGPEVGSANHALSHQDAYTQQTHKVATTSLQRRCNVLKPCKHTMSQQRRYNVAATSSRRCSDVVTTLLRRCVFQDVAATL